MMVSETDFYIASPSSHDNQIEFEYERESKTSQPTSPGKEFINPVFRSDSNDNSESVSTETQNSDTFYNRNSQYGWKCFNTKRLQILNCPLYFLICMCVAGISQGLVVTGVSFTVLTSIERQFGLKSTEVALFGTAYDVAYGVCCVFVGYIGHVHKPRWLGWGILFMVIGCLTMTIPKFVIGTYGKGLGRSDDFCRNSNSTGIKPDCLGSAEWYYNFIFILGEVLLGIGATPLFTLGTAHIVEVTDRGQGSLYLGVYYAACAFGPALGFIIGMPILNTWVDITQV